MAPSAAVALIGCGNIGFRHLQALTSGEEPAAVTVVEPNLAAHERIHQHIAETVDSSSKDVSVVASLSDTPQAFELVVVATTTDARRAVVDALLDRHQVKVLILEKVLFPRVIDLDSIGVRLAELGVSAYVNCGRRTFPGYLDLRKQLTDRSVRSIAVRGNRFGLASNAVHFLDLAEFLTDEAITSVTAAGLQPGHVSSKRVGSVEVFGTLAAAMSGGTRLTIECLDADPVAVGVAVDAEGLEVAVDELGGTVTVDGATRRFGRQAVSETTWIYDDALRTGTCSLTPYSDSARQHRALLNALRPHLGLSNEADDPCPIS